MHFIIFKDFIMNIRYIGRLNLLSAHVYRTKHICCFIVLRIKNKKNCGLRLRPSKMPINTKRVTSIERVVMCLSKIFKLCGYRSLFFRKLKQENEV